MDTYVHCVGCCCVLCAGEPVDQHTVFQVSGWWHARGLYSPLGEASGGKTLGVDHARNNRGSSVVGDYWSQLCCMHTCMQLDKSGYHLLFVIAADTEVLLIYCTDCWA
jgi:hypothetical protein